MYKKHQKIIITGSIVTTLFLSGTHFSFKKIFDQATTEKINTAYEQSLRQKTFAQHVSDQLASENLPNEKVAIYKRILEKVQSATTA